MALREIVKCAFFTPAPEGFWGLNLFVQGPPGAAKTSIIAGLARSCGLAYERLSPAERGEGQFGVVPVPGVDGYLHYPAPAWAQRFGAGGVLFLDEINTASPALQAPLLGLTQLRTLGAHQFGPRTRVIAAANETADAAGGWDLAPAIANRFCHIAFEGVPAQAWADALLTGFGRDAAPAANEAPETAEACEARVTAAWPEAIAIARGLVAAFIVRRIDLLHVQPKAHDPGAARAWPSRRTWEYVTHALAGARIHDLSPDDTHTLIAGFVGDAAAVEFAVWRLAVDLPDPAALLDGRIKWQHTNARLDRTLAVLQSCTALVLPPTAVHRNDRAAALWRLIALVAQDAPDMTLSAASALAGRGVGLAALPAAIAAMHKLHPLVAAAGFTGGR